MRGLSLGARGLGLRFGFGCLVDVGGSTGSRTLLLRRGLALEGLGLGIELCIDPEQCKRTALPVPTLPEPEKAPTRVPPTVLSELRRTAGDPQIQPPSSTKNAMSRNGEARIIAVVRMCLDTSGRVNAQNIVKSSGHAAYDAKLLSAIRKWRYEAYRASGMPVAICTHLTFIYQQE